MADTLAPPAPASPPRTPGLPGPPPPTARLLHTAARWTRRCAAVAAFLLLWETAPRLNLVDRVFLPPLSEVLDTLVLLTLNGQMGEHVSASLGRGLTGFLVAVATAVPLGALLAWYRPVYDLLAPLLELFRNTAALALLPVFVLVLGIGETSKIALVIYACTFPILLNTVTGVRTVDPLLVKSAASLGFSPVGVFARVVLPAALPSVFTGIRMAGTSSLLVLIAAEMVGARSGLGYLINAAQLNFQITHMYAGIIAIAVVGLLLNQVLASLERRFSRWRPTRA